MKNYVKKHECTTASDRRMAKCEDTLETLGARNHLVEYVGRDRTGRGEGYGIFKCRRCGTRVSAKIRDKKGDKINFRRSQR